MDYMTTTGKIAPWDRGAQKRHAQSIDLPALGFESSSSVRKRRSLKILSRAKLAVPVSDYQTCGRNLANSLQRAIASMWRFRLKDDAYSTARGYAPQQMSEFASSTHRTFFLDSQRKQSYKGNTTAR